MSGCTFNLVEEPWIPCIDSSGARRMTGFRDVMLMAHELRGLEHQNPLIEASLLRVLLALAHRVADMPGSMKDWVSLYKAGRFSEEKVDTYFGKWRDRFDLFSETTPFYQTAGLSQADTDGTPAEPVPVTAILLERASGNNTTLFDHTTEENPVRLAPHEAAQALITAQMYSLGGLFKKETNLFGWQGNCYQATLVNGIFILLTGRSLFETLLLNLLICKDNDPIPNTVKDCPVWEQQGVEKRTGDNMVPNGYLDFLTARCRHIRLVPQQGEDGLFVERLHIAQGVAFKGVENPAFYRKKNKKGEWYAPKMDEGKLVWRDSLALFAFDFDSGGKNDHRPKAFRQAQIVQKEVPLASRYQCAAYALAYDQANPLAWRKETLNIPVSLLSEPVVIKRLIQAFDLSDRAESVLYSAVSKFLGDALPENSKEIRDKVPATGAMRFYWDMLEGYFYAFLTDIEIGDKALDAWKMNVIKTARRSFEACMKQRYADTARSLKAWSVAESILNAQLYKLERGE